MRDWSRAGGGVLSVLDKMVELLHSQRMREDHQCRVTSLSSDTTRTGRFMIKTII